MHRYAWPEDTALKWPDFLRVIELDWLGNTRFRVNLLASFGCDLERFASQLSWCWAYPRSSSRGCQTTPMRSG